MKSVQPSADLPPANSHIMLTYNSLPARPHRAMPRNKTGIYLGSDVPPNSPRTYHSVPPLAKPRGMFFRPRTPTEKHRRQQRVEALRIRDEQRGFHPQPVRKAKPKLKQDETQSLPSNSSSDQAPVLRKSVRNFVAAANSGITHLEDLGLEELSLRSVSAGRESSIAPSLMDDIQSSNKKMAGLEECYSKICKGNLSSLQCLLPARKATGATAGSRTKIVATPLTIRSFRNPRSPHSVVQYSDLRNRHRSVGNVKPPVPSPYYYNSKGLPNTSDDGSSKVRLTRLPASSRNSERILAAPGVGAISQSALNRRAASLPSDPPQGIEGMPPPGLSSNAKFMDSEDRYSQKDGFRVPSGTPVVSTTDLRRIGSSSSIPEALSNGQKASPPRDPMDAKAHPTAPPTTPVRSRKLQAPANNNNSHSIPTGRASGGSLHESSIVSDSDDPRLELCGDKSEGSSGSSTLARGERVPPPGVTIMVSIENDLGESRVVDLEEEDLEAEFEGDDQEQVGHSPDSDNVSQEWQEASEKKQDELKRLLKEHHEIVSHIEELEKMTEQGGDTDSLDEDEG